MVEGVEADDVIGTLAHAGGGRGHRHASSPPATRTWPSSCVRGVTLVNTMSNEKLDEAGVLAKFGVRADQVLDLLTLTGDAVDNVPGVPKVGPKTAAKWLAQYGTLDDVIAHAGEIGGVVGENLRATLDWLPQGASSADREDRLRVACRAARSRRCGAATPTKLRDALRALRVQELAARGRTRARAGRADADRAARADARTAAPARARRARSRVDAPPAVPRTTRPCSTTRRSSAGCDAIESAELVVLRHRDDQPRSDEGADRRPVVVGRARAGGVHPARAPLRGRARAAAMRRDARAARALVRRSRAQEARPERQVRPARARQSRRRARRRRARHAAPVLRARIAQAARHGQPRVAASRRQDDHL